MKTLITTVAVLVLVAGCTTTQPPPPCLAAHGSYAVAYANTGGTPAGTCALTNSIVGVQKYNQLDGGMPTLAIRPIEIGWNDSAPETIAVGTFTNPKPDSDEFCHVETFANDSVSGTLTFKFTNVDLHVSSRAPGTQISFDVVVTDTDATNPCSATYHANAVWPVVGCGLGVDGVPLEDKNCALVDGALSGYAYAWSYLALNPDFDVKCVADPNDWIAQWSGGSIGDVGGFCVPDKPIPSFCVTEADCAWRPKE